MTFWDHLEELRGTIFRALAAILLFAVLAFVCKDAMFTVILAPTKGDFLTYRLLGGDDFALHLINTGLTEQFMVHVRTSVYAGLILASPFVLYVLFRFIAPGLYAEERRLGWRIAGSAYVMLLVGAAVNYLVVFPLAVRFLGTYQVSAEVANMLTLQSYMDTFFGMTLALSLCFELPVVCYLLGRMGILSADMMRRFRRHVFVVILIAAAVITPTGDAITLMLVALPLYALYEGSIFVVPRSKKGKNQRITERY